MILITGGAGYIGSHSVIDFIKSGYDVAVLDNLSTGHIEIVERLKKFASGAKGRFVDFIRADIRDSKALDMVFNTYNIDTVVHFAADALVNESVVNPAKYYENNVEGSINLLGAMTRHGVKKIIFSSTCATYGEPERVPVDENHPQNPVNPYGRTKLAIEFAIKDYAKAYGLKYTIFRYFNVIGADKDYITGEWHDVETHLVPNILKAGSSAPFKLFGDDYPTKDGTCVRDYIDVCDLARAHTLAYEYLQNNESIILNLGTGEGQSVKEILDAVKKALRVEIPVQMCPRREGDPAKLIADFSLAKEKLGWKSTTSLETAIKNAAGWEITVQDIKKMKEAAV